MLGILKTTLNDKSYFVILVFVMKQETHTKLFAFHFLFYFIFLLLATPKNV